ncbi:hypothetical protein [Sinorhizobium meliloti]|uniref:Uncharacterized protein n=1 Tax=Rhizobium meliloti TaxID=382 RepID=A0AAW9TSP8_RHIML|nr:hypothetical protein [Sinorhizobium meliloti]MCM5689507.1 hypothetical protein [Sinorhizobium meliloti]MDE4621733.1 hypothetical protein [Sinorhizobium meliloti]MQW35034.1 hypothetical protein [Sinorhizobium meliloti]QGJ73810.1 hypothetical protein C3L21_07160 [Sinorhizobium meliloti]RVG89031.1 hypothetical protein CN218_26130 [Sinorhizobium meliloti]
MADTKSSTAAQQDAEKKALAAEQQSTSAAGEQPSSAGQEPASQAEQADPVLQKAMARFLGTPIKLLYDTWADDEKRIPAGTVLEVPVSIAKQLIDAGKAERADPLPGDDE